MDENVSTGSVRQDIVANSSEAEFNLAEYRSIGEREICHLKSMALKSPRNRYRLCLHSEQTHLTQEMVICLKGFNYFQPHRHPGNRSESYHMIEGRMDVYLFDEIGGLIDTIRLSAPSAVKGGAEERDFMYRLSAPIYHLMIPRSDWTIYHEVLTGPWSKETVVEYASFAPSENELGEVERYTNEVTGLTIDDLIE
jgi:cupin fold WbuC family metalloprotein